MKLTKAQLNFLKVLASGKIVRVSGSIYHEVAEVFIADAKVHPSSVRTVEILLHYQLIYLSPKDSKLQRKVKLTELGKSILGIE